MIHHLSTLIPIAAFAILAMAIPVFSMVFTPSPLGAAEKLLVRASPQVSAGVNFVPKSKYKIIFLGAAASATPANILAGYTAQFGSLVTGNKIFLEVSSINASGFQSTPTETNQVVA